MRTIVVGYDGTGQAERVLTRAAELARALAAKLIVVSVGRSPPVPAPVSVLEPIPPVLTAGATGMSLPPEALPGPLQPEPGETAALLERARGLLAPHGVDAEYVAELGDPAERLLEVADERDAELIVVGSRERSFLERLIADGTDEKLARKAHRDVLLVH
jgi:nucleotide-binding universal stress UspA family protein